MSLEERGLLTEILKDEHSMDTVLGKGISPKFLNGKYKEAFKYIMKHQESYGKPPALTTFKQNFPEVRLITKGEEIDSEEPLEYWIDLVRIKRKHNRMAEVVEDTITLMNSKETDKAFDALSTLVVEVENDVMEIERADLTTDVEGRWEAYKERQKSGGVVGLPTGNPDIDRITGGYEKEELITVMGYTGIGKSWNLLLSAVHQAKMGYKVLMLTTEMSVDAVMERVDCLWLGISYSRFVVGQLKRSEEEKYKKFLEEMKENPEGNLLVVDQVTGGVSQVGAKIDRIKPDICYVDGAYLLDSGRTGGDEWQDVIAIWRGLHKLSKDKKIPIVASTQSKEPEGTSLKTLNFAKALAHDCDIILAMEQDTRMRNDKEVLIKPLKLRKGSVGTQVILSWDFTDMKFGTILEESTAESIDAGDVEAVIEL